MNAHLYAIVKQLLAPKKGVLASDESIESANKNLAKVGVEGTKENRRLYRELFIGTPGIGKYLSGIILFDETLRQCDTNRIPFRDILKKEGVLIGIKVDKGTKPIPAFEDEVYTQGLDGLDERIDEYVALGAKFAKWRCVFEIGEKIPTDEAIDINMIGLAQYASICQKGGLVPIVEPEVLYNGNHSIAQANSTTTKVLQQLVLNLHKYKVDLKATVLKTGMVLAGKDYLRQSEPNEVASVTVQTLRETLPKELGGIVFLSGGQTPDQATLNLDAIAKLEPLPWEIAFSFLRAIEGPSAEIWAGQEKNVPAARTEFLKRLKDNTRADVGKFSVKD